MGIETGQNDIVIKRSTETVSGSDLMRECIMLQSLSAPGFPRLVGYFHGGLAEPGFLVMQKLHRDLQSLHADEYICPNQRFSAESAIGVGVQMIERLEFMHRVGILHRDLKPENMMIASRSDQLVYL